MTEDQMVGWYHGLNGHEFEQTPGDSEGQGNMVCCSSWGCRDSDTTERLNNNKYILPCVKKVASRKLCIAQGTQLISL